MMLRKAVLTVFLLNLGSLLVICHSESECICDQVDDERRRLLTYESTVKQLTLYPAEMRGTNYIRPQKSLEISKYTRENENPLCDSEQVHMFIGSEPNSVIIRYASFIYNTSTYVNYCTNLQDLIDHTANVLTTNGTVDQYSQQLYMNDYLTDPPMGAPTIPEEYLRSREDTSQWAYDKTTGEHFYNWVNVTEAYYGYGQYNNPFMYYDSPMLHSVTLRDIAPNTTYYYRVAGSCRVFEFRLPAEEGDSPGGLFPFMVGLTADIGQTEVSNKSVYALLALNPQVVLLPGDLSYSDGWFYRWDSFGRMIEPLASSVPMLITGGNHEVESSENWVSLRTRYPTPYRSSGSPNFCYYGKEIGPMHLITLCTYDNTHNSSFQHSWLASYLDQSINRTKTPWVVVQMHSPWYSTNVGHWREADLMRQSFETLLYEAGVDLIIAGHIHAYERIKGIYQYEDNSCGPEYLVIGDGGNYEAAYVPWRWNTSGDGEKKDFSYSAFRESSFGVASLNFLNESAAAYSWLRHACMSNTSADFYMNFTYESCQTPGDDSTMAMEESDSTVFLKPPREQCANRWKSSVNLISTSSDADSINAENGDSSDNCETWTDLNVSLLSLCLILFLSNIVSIVMYFMFTNGPAGTDENQGTISMKDLLSSSPAAS